MKNNEQYSISELSKRADVTKRTIHYYVQRRLIPPPERRGVNSKYSDEHYYRILFIKQQQEKFYPLAKIKEIIQFMSLDEIRRNLSLKDEIKFLNLVDTVSVAERSRSKKGNTDQIKRSASDRISQRIRNEPDYFLSERFRPGSEDLSRLKFEENIELVYPVKMENSEIISQIVNAILDIFQKRGY